jgi:Flp pilus assembly protein TadD
MQTDFNHALASFRAGKLDDAEQYFKKVLKHDPTNVGALNILGIVLTYLQKYDEAEGYLRSALQAKPSATTRSNFGLVLYQKGKLYSDSKRYSEAISAYEEALGLEPNFAEGWLGLGIAFAKCRQHDEAFRAFEKAQILQSTLAHAHYNEAILRLLLGDYERGWKQFESRWQLPGRPRRNFAQPLWLGESSIAGDTILLHAEAGFGDTIMAGRYVPMVAALGATVILEVQPLLLSLMKSLTGVSTLIATGETNINFDVHCPLMSLPLAFRTRLETIPDKVPYLKPSPESSDRWRAKLAGTEFKVGIAWAGNPEFIDDRERSIPLKDLSPILSNKGARFFSLQKDLREGDLEILKSQPQVTQLGESLGNFDDTAGAITALDLIVSVDTAIANLAGALGKPVWVLLPHNPDFRWLLDRNYSPWFPTAKLFRQKEGGAWPEVMSEVGVELERLLIAPISK